MVDLAAERRAHNARLEAKAGRNGSTPPSEAPVEPAAVRPAPAVPPVPAATLEGGRGPGARLSKADRMALRRQIRLGLEREPGLSVGQLWRQLGEPLTLNSFKRHFDAVTGPRPAKAKPEPNPTAAAPPKVQPAHAGESVQLCSAVGEYSASPAGSGRWCVTLNVTVDRRTALQLNGQAWALLFPD